MLHCVEVALLEVVRHAGEISVTPFQHRAEGSAESPHLQKHLEKKKGVQKSCDKVLQ